MSGLHCNQEWKCSSCSFTNNGNRNIIPCQNCLTLDSDANLKRARALYILGNILKPSVSLIPLKENFFIYPLSSPIITHTLKYDYEKNTTNATIYFHVELWDNKHIEQYHIESIKVDYFANTANSNTPKSSTIIYNRSPYNQIFCLHIQNIKQCVKMFEIDAKCYNSECVAPKTKYQIMFHNVSVMCTRKRKLESVDNTTINVQPLKRHKNDKNNGQCSNIEITNASQTNEMVLCDANNVSITQTTNVSGTDDTNILENKNVHKTEESDVKWYKWYWIDDNGRQVEGEW